MACAVRVLDTVSAFEAVVAFSGSSGLNSWQGTTSLLMKTSVTANEIASIFEKIAYKELKKKKEICDTFLFKVFSKSTSYL